MLLPTTAWLGVGLVVRSNDRNTKMMADNDIVQERTGRFQNRYIIDHNFHAQDLKGDHIRNFLKFVSYVHVLLFMHGFFNSYLYRLYLPMYAHFL